MIQEKLSRIIPEPLRPLARVMYNGLISTRRSINDFRIGRIQTKLLRHNFSHETENLIIFLTPGQDIVNGMILAIYHHYLGTKNLESIHNAEVLMCTLPKDPLLLKYTKFNFRDYVFGFSQVLSYFENLQNLIIHVTIGNLPIFVENLSKEDILRLQRIQNVHINILIQHIGTLQSNIRHIEHLKKIELGKLTATTAHEAYTTLDLRKKLGFPLHKLSTYVSPEFYERKEYDKKRDLLTVSPDYHSKKMEILNTIKKRFPQLKIRIIKNISYEEYKKLISDAKWAITFGEGLDGYFVETIFSGGISFATHNPDFFTEDFKALRTVYGSYEEMAERICEDIETLDNETSYTEYQNEQFKLASKYYNYEKYLKNLELFYKGVYTYP
jgi:hypothetical protein